jgi:hypothetical protein
MIQIVPDWHEMHITERDFYEVGAIDRFLGNASDGGLALEI